MESNVNSVQLLFVNTDVYWSIGSQIKVTLFYSLTPTGVIVFISSIGVLHYTIIYIKNKGNTLMTSAVLTTNKL